MAAQPRPSDRFSLSEEDLDEILQDEYGRTRADVRRARAARRERWQRRLRRVLLLRKD